ncbi:MAG: hypothetical protein ACK520_17610 [Inhella sp.]|nr:hypothetical protein [Inhella sp.]
MRPGAPCCHMLLTIATAIKLICEIALLAMLGRFLLGVLIGGKRQDNLAYQALHLMVRPLERLVRALTPSVVVDRHIGHVTAALLIGLWVFALLWKVDLCRQIGVQQCL